MRMVAQSIRAASWLNGSGPIPRASRRSAAPHANPPRDRRGRRGIVRVNLAVMLGPVPSIHALNTTCIGEDVDGRHRGDHDGESAVLSLESPRERHRGLDRRRLGMGARLLGSDDAWSGKAR